MAVAGVKRPLGGRKESVFRWREIVSVQNDVQPITGLGVPADQTGTMGDQPARISPPASNCASLIMSLECIQERHCLRPT